MIDRSFAMKLGGLVLLVGLTAIARPGFAQSDACTTATAIKDGAYSGGTVGANNDGSNGCGGSPQGPDVWYSYTPAVDCLLTLNMCGSGYDTTVSVHSACPGTAGNEIACNDDFAPCGTSSRLQLAVAGGTEYRIRVSGWNAASGAYNLNVSCNAAPPSDSCGSALVIGQGTHFGDTFAATNDGTADCGNSATSPDTWFSYTAAEDCTLAVDTCGSNWDSVLSVHTGCPGTAGNQIVCNDDVCNSQSRVLFPATTGNTYLIRVAGFEGATGAFALHVNCLSTGGPGADVFIGELNVFEQYGREGDVVGCAIDTPLCNAGDQPLDWFANPDPRHPFMVFNLYRLDANNRFEQIGQSWAKHGFGAAQESACGFACTPNPDSTRLGVGCSDTYSASLNAFQSIMGPRHEINPWTGAFVYAGSHQDTQVGGHDAVEHRLQLRDADIDPALNPGATYFAECYILAHDDVDHMNSVVREPVVISGSPGGTWSFNIGGSNTLLGPAIESWPGVTFTTIPQSPVDDGRCILAANVTDNGDGTWHYEYALYNHDMDRGVGAFTIPVLSAITMTNVGFSAVESDQEGYINDAWSFSRSGDAATWSTIPFNINPNSNPLRWGTMYNFRFDADAPPQSTMATLGMHKPGTPASLTGITQGPAAGPPIPTVSTWGAVVVSLVMFVVGTRVAQRRGSHTRSG